MATPKFARESLKVTLLKGDAAGDLEAQNAKQGLKESRTKLCGLNVALVSGISYCIASGSMVLINKHALNPKSFNFTAPTVLLCFQCVFSALMAKVFELFSKDKIQPFTPTLLKLWFPVNLIFVGMIGSNFYALKTVGVAMVAIWKNVSNVITAICDVTIYKKSYSYPIWGCLLLMITSAIVGAYTDLSFSWNGYAWQFCNCFFTSAYALYLRSVMDKVKPHTYNRQKLNELSMVYFNNLLSIPPLLFLICIFGEHKTILQQEALANPYFYLVAILGSIFAFNISFTAMWFLSNTTATIYSLVGALNKIPVSVFGILVLHETSSFNNILSIAIGLGAGVVFVIAKSRGM